MEETKSGHDQVRLGKVGECLLECIRKEQAAGLLKRQSRPGWGKSRQFTGDMSPVACYRLGEILVSWWRLLLVDERLSVSAKVTKRVAIRAGSGSSVGLRAAKFIIWVRY